MTVAHKPDARPKTHMCAHDPSGKWPELGVGTVAVGDRPSSGQYASMTSTRLRGGDAWTLEADDRTWECDNTTLTLGVSPPSP